MGGDRPKRVGEGMLYCAQRPHRMHRWAGCLTVGGAGAARGSPKHRTRCGDGAPFVLHAATHPAFTHPAFDVCCFARSSRSALRWGLSETGRGKQDGGHRSLARS
jgi:hypothetical protein